ncbi:hypothetical protein MAPG_05035 [Magnaporthiopsis poae ATCC 64411]|uniref:Uncharacterized protein n=1 Tax=Magnaporthiopsis poae (strain ATCC 64411 / 73-15) TaxID=644358 RepID=A0A0C4DYB7_MAGP6|nr:hypothetical protein MAPG_05035 [Magnaporthiopsis poae ATCC 64411]
MRSTGRLESGPGSRLLLSKVVLVLVLGLRQQRGTGRATKKMGWTKRGNGRGLQVQFSYRELHTATKQRRRDGEPMNIAVKEVLPMKDSTKGLYSPMK